MPKGPTGGPTETTGAESMVAGSFEIIEELGRGGMGVVYRARDLRLEREVALKRPRQKLLDEPGFRDRFMSEARTASKLMHPNITTVFEVFEDDGVPWMAMELIRGSSLRTILEDHNPIPFENVMTHAEGLGDALRVAHAGGFIHRDVKPANILIGGDGRARLSDFGLAGVWAEANVEESGSQMTTETGTSGRIIGTRGYMSPEQALGKRLDARSDLFSLGVVLYEMCAGRRAFPVSDSAEWLDALLHREPEPISDLNRNVPREFQEIVRKAMAKRRFQRYQSANEMLLDIRAMRKWIESDSGHSPIRHFFGGARSKSRIWIGAVVIAVILSAAWVMTRSPGRPVAAAEWTPRRVTRAPGWEAEPALSPDGSLIAYSSDASGNPDIWLVDATGGNPLRLTDDPGSDRDPTWFPDGSAIAFVSDRNGAHAIWKMPVLGGDPVLLVPDGTDPAVAPDGSSIAFAFKQPEGTARIGIARFDDPTDVDVITDDGDGVLDHTSPAWSPDGKTICYSDFRDLWLVSATEGGHARRLTSTQAMDRGPVWSSDGRFIFYSSYSGGTRSAIWWVPANGGKPHRFTSGTGPEVSPSLNREGTRLAYTTLVEDLDLVIVDRVDGRRLRMPGSNFQSLPAISPDGRGVAFAVDSGDRYDLWYQTVTENGPGVRQRLTDHPVTVATPTFSPDGAWIAFFGVLNEQRDVWIVPAEGGVPRRFTDNEAVDIHPAFSPDGRSLAFVSTRGDDRSHIWVAPIENGARVGDPSRVTRGEGMEWFPSWSADGRSLAYLASSGGDADVWVVGLDPETRPRQVTHGVVVHYVRWGEDSDSLLVSGLWDGVRVELRKVSVEDGSVEPLEVLIVFGGEDAFGLFSLTSDGHFICFYEENFGGDVWMLERR